MGRLTKLVGYKYCIEENHLEKAVEKLGIFEDLCLEITEEQKRISAELEVLRTANKKNSYHFKELMGKKLTNTSMLILLKNSGLIE